jgi:CRISPR-associated protein Csx3
MTPDSPLIWSVTVAENHSVAEFRIASEDGLLSPASLGRASLPPEADARRDRGLILSGRGPIWLYGHLLHEAHPFAWAAVHDPRLGGAVVVARHVPAAPALGAVIVWEKA